MSPLLALLCLLCAPSEAAPPSLRVRASATSSRPSLRATPDILASRSGESGLISDAIPPKRSESAQRNRELLLGRCTVLACLFGFTFFNGVARRSLSSAGPSLVSEGMITEIRAEDVFSLGFDAFALGKLLVLPTLLLLGEKSALLLQVAAVTLSCLALAIAPGTPIVQSGAWVVLRIFSAMATSTMLPFVGHWFPRPAYGRVFAWIFTGFQAGYFFVSVYWQHLLFSHKGLHWRLPFVSCTAIGCILFVACSLMLKERPSLPPRQEKVAAELPAPLGRKPPRLLPLVTKMRTRWVFWAMLLTVFAYTPIVEYSTHVTTYLKEMPLLAHFLSARCPALTPSANHNPRPKDSPQNRN